MSDRAMMEGLRTFLNGGAGFVPQDTLLRVYQVAKQELERRTEGEVHLEAQSVLAHASYGGRVWLRAKEHQWHLTSGSPRDGFKALCGIFFFLTTRQVCAQLKHGDRGRIPTVEPGSWDNRCKSCLRSAVKGGLIPG